MNLVLLPKVAKKQLFNGAGNFKIRISNDQNIPNTDSLFTRFGHGLDSEFWSFVFVSDFVLRVSNLREHNLTKT